MQLPTWLGRGFMAMLLLISNTGSFAATTKVLWYTYAAPTSTYISGIRDIAANAQNYSKSSGQAWDVTFFYPGDPAPDFAAFNVLVIHSGEAFRTEATPSGPLATPNYSGILNNKAAIQAARGERTYLSGADGDFHALRRDTGVSNQTDPEHWNGALGYAVNAINWAGSGNGLGIVSFVDREFPGSTWWDDPNAFLHDELAGKTTAQRDNLPVIPAAAATFPLNYGLSSAGLSNWTNSFHGRFVMPIPGYTSIVDSAVGPQFSVTIVTSDHAEAAAGPTPLLEFAAASYSVGENDAGLNVAVTRSVNARGSVSVDYATRDASAVATSDYTLRTGTLTFADGDTSVKMITIPITADNVAEGNETFSIRLVNPQGAVLGTQQQATISIIDGPVANSGGGGGGGCTVGQSGDGTLPLLLIAALFVVMKRRCNCKRTRLPDNSSLLIIF